MIVIFKFVMSTNNLSNKKLIIKTKLVVWCVEYSRASNNGGVRMGGVSQIPEVKPRVAPQA